MSEDQMKFEPLSDDFDQNDNDGPLENGFGKKLIWLCNYWMKIQTISSWYSCILLCFNTLYSRMWRIHGTFGMFIASAYTTF